jgi:hypothetical protein
MVISPEQLLPRERFMSPRIASQTIPRALKYLRSRQNQIQTIRSNWARTDAGRNRRNQPFKGAVEDEADVYFNATLWNAFMHLDRLEGCKAPSAEFTANAKKLRQELKLIGELDEFIFRLLKTTFN